MTVSTTLPPALSAFSPLRHATFRAMWIGYVASSTGGIIQAVGAAWMMTELSDSPIMVALIQSSVALPLMLLSLPAGALADNMDRRRLMIGAQIFMLLMSVVLCAGTWLGLIDAWTLLLLTFAVGCGTAIQAPAWPAAVSNVVPRADMAGAIALNSMGFNLARSVGPAIGGAIIALVGTTAAFAVNVVSFGGFISALAKWKPEASPRPAHRETLMTTMARGIVFASRSAAMRAIILRGFLFGVGASALPALMPLVARDILTGGPLTYGLLLGSYGIGAIAGGIGSARFAALLSPEGRLRFAFFACAIGAAFLALSPILAASMFGSFLAGCAWLITLTILNISAQLNAPPHMTGRAISFFQMSMFAGVAGGSWLFGTISKSQGLSFALLIAAGLLVVGLVAGFAAPMRIHSDQQEDK